MGLIVEIYRAKYRSRLCAFDGVDMVTVTNIPGPFEPTDDRPAARLEKNAYGSAIIVPDMPNAKRFSNGGSYGGSSDSRFRDAVGIYGAIPIHDYDMSKEG